MPARVRCDASRPLVHYFSRFLLATGVTLLSAQSMAVQEATPVDMPESVVLVLKLVSATYVKPTTGVVISADGMVLIPADFVAAGDEIVVLDGGTDIIRNGRPGRTVKRSVANGLAVLSVEGLARPGIILSQGDPLQARSLHLAAFPPAEKMAQGAPPLWVPIRLVKSDAYGGLTVSGNTPLPNTTGPILDGCGYLVGLNLAMGGQSLAQDKSPVTIFGEDLARIFDAMQIDLQREICRQAAQPAAQAEPAADRGVPDKKPGPLERTAAVSDGDLPPAVTEAPATGLRPKLTLGTSAAPAQIVAVQDSTRNSTKVPGAIPLWLWIAGSAILAILLAKLVSFLRLGKPGRRQPAFDDHPCAQEPDTAPLDTTSDFSNRNSGTMPADEGALPDIDDLPAGSDGIIVIEGCLGDNSGFRRHCVVNTKHIDIIIGRGDADICIETPALSRRHARLVNDGDSLTISDLGSSNGTFIRGIPCLPAEIMFIGPEDEILLGDVRFRVSVLTSSGTVQ